MPFIKIDKERIITSTEALALKEVPKHLVIIGGGVIDAGELFLAPVRDAMSKYMPFAGTHKSPKIIAAKFGNDAGLIGAAELVRG